MVHVSVKRKLPKKMNGLSSHSCLSEKKHSTTKKLQNQNEKPSWHTSQLAFFLTILKPGNLLNKTVDVFPIFSWGRGPRKYPTEPHHQTWSRWWWSVRSTNTRWRVSGLVNSAVASSKVLKRHKNVLLSCSLKKNWVETKVCLGIWKRNDDNVAVSSWFPSSSSSVSAASLLGQSAAWKWTATSITAEADCENRVALSQHSTNSRRPKQKLLTGKTISADFLFGPYKVVSLQSDATEISFDCKHPHRIWSLRKSYGTRHLSQPENKMTKPGCTFTWLHLRDLEQNAPSTTNIRHG